MDVSDMTEQKIKEAQTGSWVFIEVGCRLVDAMEDFSVKIHLAQTLAAA